MGDPKKVSKAKNAYPKKFEESKFGKGGSNLRLVLTLIVVVGVLIVGKGIW